MRKHANAYDTHFLLDEKTVVDFVKDTSSFFDESADLSAKEIGDGNINYVFKIQDKKSGKSVVIKQADTRLKSSGRPLDVYRNKIEVEILKMQNNFAPGKVPIVYDYHATMCALMMEDISAFKNLRNVLLDGQIYKNFSEEITDFMVDVLFSTTDLLMDRHKKKELVQSFTNIDLCDISEDLVFTEPYYNYKNRNIITKGNEAFVNLILYKDENLKREVGILRNTFMNSSQALIHGDLHSGSIFINEKGIKVIDPEFAFYGPIGYDVGNVIGNLFFALAHQWVLNPEHSIWICWMEQTIQEIYDKFKEKALVKLKKEIKCPLYNDSFIKLYVESVLMDAVGMAGTEIIRRTVGDTKVKDITEIQNQKQRLWIERVLILTGTSFIKYRDKLNCGRQLVEEFIRWKESVNI